MIITKAARRKAVEQFSTELQSWKSIYTPFFFLLIMLQHAPAYQYIKTKDLDRAYAFYTKILGLSGGRRVKGGIQWASVKTANGRLWLGEHGASTGLIFIVKDVEKAVQQLKRKKVKFYIPTPMKKHGMKTHIACHPWGRHAWFRDSEGNEVMLFEARGVK